VGATATREDARALNLWSAAAIVALALLGFFVFPGHTYLQADTQIYVPFLEHLQDPGVLGRDLLARNPPAHFTIYDETALWAARATGLDLETVLAAEQILFRALGLVGVFLIAAALGFERRLALLVTAAFSLGAVIVGPSVLTIEYEPIPRAFAIPLVLLAAGLAANGRTVAAGTVAALAVLFHPPSAAAFCVVFLCVAWWRRSVLPLVPLAAAVLALLVTAQTGGFFGRIAPEVERIQRFRASYNWVSMWPHGLFRQYVFLWLFSLGAYLRVRKLAPRDAQILLLGLPLTGLLSIPVSYLLLEKLKWIAGPQIQPARAVLFVTAFAVILGAAAAMEAVRRGRVWESVLWLVPVFAVPAQGRVLEILWPDLSLPLIRTRVLVVLVLAVLTAFAAWAVASRRRWCAAAAALAALVPFYALPQWAKVRNYGRLGGADMDRLISWAGSATARDAMFLFPDAGRGLDPGLFRAKARRALYVDWKSGGQANFEESFAREWWSRWQKSGAGEAVFADLGRYRALGIDYIVLKPAHRLAGAQAVFEDAGFVVYRCW
jgi:hypothetical protein